MPMITSLTSSGSVAFRREAALAIVRQVALTISAGDVDAAQTVSMRAWTRARALVANAAGPATAQGACAAIGLRWADTLTLALADPATRGVAAGRLAERQGRPSPDGLVRHALRAVAFELGHSPRPDDYDAVATRLDRDRAARFGSAFGLPCAATIQDRAGSWQRALDGAGLPPAPPPPSQAGPAPALLCDRMIDETGLVPTKRLLEHWCRAGGVQLGRGVRDWAQVLRDTVELRRAAAKPWPTRRATRADYARISRASVAPAVSTRRPAVRPVEDVLESLRRYAALLTPGERPTQKHYHATKRARPEAQLVAHSTIARHGRFQDLYAAATAPTR